MIGLIDYGSGNVRSVHKALLHCGAEVKLVSRPDELAPMHGAVLPGVGAFDDCLNALGTRELLQACRQFIDSGRAFLGICVGYQALFDRSEEFNSCASGMGLFKGNVVRFSTANGLKIPQIGWNQVEITRPECPFLTGIENGSYFYFVHSFFPRPADASIVETYTTYGEKFASSVWRDNVFATQFHPEKSQKVGLRLIGNFVALTRK